jgi:hypothetical protein
VIWSAATGRRYDALDYVESCNFGCAKTDGYIYPSYYEKNADNNTFSVADWVRGVVPAERLPGPDRQPIFTVHDIPDWDTWLNPAEWDPVENACEARWRVWKRGPMVPIGPAAGLTVDSQVMSDRGRSDHIRRQSSRFEAILNSPRSKRMRPRQRRRLEALAARLRAARAASG